MGWLYNTRPQSKQDFVKELLQRNFNPNYDVHLLEHSLRGNQLWTLVQPGKEDPVIVLYLLACDKGCWGYKDMDESMGPYYYDCPISWFDRAPEPRGWRSHGDTGRGWRDIVRERHAARQQRRRNRPKVGQRIRLKADDFGAGYAGEYLVVDDLGRRGLRIRKDDVTLRMKANQVRYAELVPEEVPA